MYREKERERERMGGGREERKTDQSLTITSFYSTGKIVQFNESSKQIKEQYLSCRPMSENWLLRMFTLLFTSCLYFVQTTL